MTSEKVDNRRHAPQVATPEKRTRPFSSVLFVGLVVVPGFGVLLRVIVAIDPTQMILILWLDIVFVGLLLPALAIGIGYKVTRRVPIVWAHVAGTLLLFAIATSITVVVGWPAAGAPWWRWAIAPFWWPAWWVVTHLFGSVAVAMSWLLYRIDALRSNPRGESGDERNGLAELLNWPKGAKIRPGTIESDGFATTAIVDHDGIPKKKIEATKDAIEEKGFIRGRSSVIGEPVGGSSRVRFVHTDPMKTWRTWPGPSHPGGSFVAPFRTSYYSTGETQWIGFAQTPEGFRSHLAPDFVVPNDAHIGRQGATRSGKSGDVACEICEALTRRDCAVILVNTAKLFQDSGWCLDQAELAADSKPRARAIFGGIRRVGEYRQRVMGDPRHGGRHRTWTPDTYADLGLAALLVEVDEGDQVLSADDATWLATKGLSLGIYLSTSISRAATDGMASTLRSAIVQWKAFGCGQQYDSGFVLTDETQAAGADPHVFGIEFKGAHYADRLQGVDHRLYPIDARSFQTERDFSDLRKDVMAARATFPVPHLTDGEIEAFGRNRYEWCQPNAVMIGAAKPDQPVGRPAEPDDEQEETDMNETQEMERGSSDSGDPQVDEAMEMSTDVSEIHAEFGQQDPKTPIPDREEPTGLQFDQDKPMVSPEQTGAEFDAALVRMARRGVREFGNQDVMREMRVAMRPARCSERFAALCSGEVLDVRPPPGVTVERLGRGRYLMTWVGIPVPDGA